MKNRLFVGVLSLGLLAGASYAQEGYKNEATVSALGSFQQTTNGNGIQQSANNAAGVLFSYRYFFTNHQGVELNYGFSRFDQQFSSPGTSLGTLAVPANTNEATASYIYKFGSRHRFTPFVSAGTGAFLFVPQNSFSVNNVSSSRFATPDFVYSAGADIAVSRRVSLRLGYRGHVFQAPDFGIAGLSTGSVAHLAEPFGGLSFHF
ncbi:MAG: outer membrane beta-barrel protein [Acidobacteriaceae bacterium]|nr:outer membrane beta-barrel protein [Acidobacteriaceae bacterium]MBV9224908.1 outer membrane beta-barrel protein [Acidobacteriaceae bacterium]MBV9674842.1 outer membrane beta-barrel protein [Acidobacteriaceae bacterium]MBV9937960.1 outer membrane beta-barrel protein [Acidobacteriaceae bacterium]